MLGIRKLAAACCAIVVAACGKTPEPPLADDLAAIADFNRRYVQAINDGDVATLSSLTTADHIMLTPNAPPRVGKEANDAANARAFERFDIDESWMPEETVIDGDLAYQRGTYVVESIPKAGGPYALTRRAYGHVVGVIVGWADFLTSVLVLSFLATLYPAFRAARTDPVETLRYE